MKKVYAIFRSFLVLLVAAVSVASCDVYIEDNPYDPAYPSGRGDRGRANVISGEWQGSFGMFYTATNPYTGAGMQFDAINTYILFQSDYYNARTGTGKQIDFYDYGPLRQRYHHFVWEVRGGVLYLSYPGEPALNVAIYDYVLNDYTFSGRSGDSSFLFNLRKLSFGNWARYSINDFDDPYTGWSWLNVRGVQDADNPLPAEASPIVGGRK